MLEDLFILIYFILCLSLIEPIHKMANKKNIIQCIGIIDILGTYNLTITLILAFLFFTKNNFNILLGNISNKSLTIAIITNIVLSIWYLVYYEKKLKKFETINNVERTDLECLISCFWFITLPVIYIKLKYFKKKD